MGETCLRDEEAGLFLNLCHRPTSHGGVQRCRRAEPGFPFRAGIKQALFPEDGARASAHGVHVGTHNTDCVHTRVKGDNRHKLWIQQPDY